MTKVDDQLNVWLNDQANGAQIPDEYRAQFIDEMRKSAGFASLRLRLETKELVRIFKAGLPAWLRRIVE